MTNQFATDIPEPVARAAHAGTSFVPEERAQTPLPGPSLLTSVPTAARGFQYCDPGKPAADVRTQAYRNDGTLATARREAGL